MYGLIIDGYVDEPACFGVPPYVSPYVRYACGAMADASVDAVYRTCDQWRQMDVSEKADLTARAAVIVVIAGLTVPGRYRGGSPMTMGEFLKIASLRRGGPLILGGPISMGYALRGGQEAVHCPDGADCVATDYPEAVLFGYLSGRGLDGGAVRTYDEVDRWAVLGAHALQQHPSYPHVMAEIELSRGCDRTDGHCSFCTEGIRGRLQERSMDGVFKEIASLHEAGVLAYRLGRCANILTYGGTDTPSGRAPRPEALEALYAGIRAHAHAVRVLHTDNCNPQTVARFPDAAESAVSAIARHNTPLDTLSLGIESLAPEVRRLNNLKVSYEEALTAVRIINAAGAQRFGRSTPKVLPGLNFLVGLPGETGRTMDENRRFLETLLEEGLMVRRINIRRPMSFSGTSLSGMDKGKVTDRDYRRFKEWVRSCVDTEMFARVAPPGTIIEGVICEERSGHLMFGRPLGSYPPLLGIASPSLEVGDVCTVAVTGAGPRSLSAVPYPVVPREICSASEAMLCALPGIGKARALRIINAHPQNFKDIADALDDMPPGMPLYFSDEV